MYLDLWTLILRILALTLGILAFGGLSVVHLVLIKQKSNIIKFRVSGFILLTIALIFKLLSLFFDTIPVLIWIYLFIFMVGICSYLYSLLLVTLPKKPKLPVNIHRIGSYILPFIPIVIAAIWIIVNLLKKIAYGLKKEYFNLFTAWIFFVIFVLMEAAALAGVVPLLSIVTVKTQVFIYNIIQYGSLLVSSFLFASWIIQFLEFSPIIKLTLSVWQLVVVISMSLATGFAYLTLSKTENQITDLLSKNINLINYTISVTKNSLNDFTTMINHDSGINIALENQDSNELYSEINQVLKANSTIDKVVVTDSEGIIVTNSSDYYSSQSITGNTFIKDAIINQKQTQGLLTEKAVLGNYRTALVNCIPLKNGKGTFIGVIAAYKYLDNSFLDAIKMQSGQELFLYVNGYRTASTFQEGDSLARYSNIPYIGSQSDVHSVTETIQIGSITMNTKEYLTSISSVNGNNEVKLLSAIERAPLIESAKNIIKLTYIWVIILCILSVIPTYFIAKQIDEAIGS